MHNALLSICLLLFPSLIISQNLLSGIINSYTEVTDIDYCENSLVISTADGFEENMAAILIQMTGATINNSNTSDFGDIDNLGNTGHFEKCRIQSINGNTLILQNPLINQYDLAANIQLVSMPAFDNAEITETLIASVWNGQTGGVLALEITNTLTLNANIDASATGFPGGPGDVSASNNCSFTTNANDYFYALDNWRGAPKGSGIAPYLNDQEAGRGAQANGGGGGNDHNAGGGGGANISNGGRGGENREPSFFGCDGNFPGEGGKALQQDINRIFMGGGGGAGHENNNLNPTGGRGGGIVILEAAFIASNNQQILANGATPASINGDGAGGGGAGGTIVVLVDDGSGNLELIARGGNGGEANNNGEDRCMGPGGGGSGGRILTNINGNLNFTTDLSGGAAGQSINSSEGNCPNGPNGAQPGQDGISETIQQLPQSTEPNTPPNILSQDTNLTACDGTGINLSTEVEGFQLQFQWQIDTGSGFMDLAEASPYSNTNTPVLNINPVNEDMSGNSYRLVISSDCFSDLTSQVISLNVEAPPVADFDFNQTGDLSFEFINLSNNANSYLWDFGDDINSTLENPSHTYAEEGNYTVTLTVFNGCDTLSTSQMINITGAPTAGFSFSPENGCAPLTVQYTNESSANASGFAWFFVGGTPAFSLEENPMVVYNNPGIYGALLIVSNLSGTDSLMLENIITVDVAPVASFSFDVDDLEVSFENNSDNAVSYQWDFGDTFTSNLPEPTHTYAEAGTYTVTLIATGPCGSAETSQEVTVGAPPQAAFSSNIVKACAPFPVQFFNQSEGTYENLSWAFPGGNPMNSSEENPVVIYTNPGVYTVSLTVEGTLGSNTITAEDYIEILPVPEPDFSFIILEDGTVIFNNASTDADSYNWDFGDGNSSTEYSPVHTYSGSGLYTVTLNASNPFCGKAISMDVVIMLTDIEEPVKDKPYKIFPNPTKGWVQIERNTDLTSMLQYSVYNTMGKLLEKNDLYNNQTLDLSRYPDGLYFILIRAGQESWMEKILLHK